MPVTNLRHDQIDLQPQQSAWTLNAVPQHERDSTTISDTQAMSLSTIKAGASRQSQLSTIPMAPSVTTEQGSSTVETYGSLSLPASSSSSSVCSSAIAGEDDQEISKPETPQRSVRRRPRISDLQQTGSARELLYQEFVITKGDSHKKNLEKRARSADPSVKIIARFNSLDRYTATRSYLNSSSSPLRTARRPSSLETGERFHRRRGSNADAFEAANESRQGQATNRPAPNRLRSFQPPHFTPSFVHILQRGTERDRTSNATSAIGRRPSNGSIWRLGGWSPVPGQLRGVDLGNGTVTASGTNAPMIDSGFSQQTSSDTYTKRHEVRLALALDIDVAQRVLPVTELPKQLGNGGVNSKTRYQWLNGSWTHNYNLNRTTKAKASSLRPEKVVPTIAFRVLDAPRLKDDYYCSVLAYCQGFRTLAVALTHRVYLWTERYGVRYPPLAPARPTNYVSSLAFSSEEGGKAILATSRSSGIVTLWSLLEQRARFELPHSSAACSTAFKPLITRRPSTRNGSIVGCEDLLVGDDVGHVYYYSVEWPDYLVGSVTLLTKIEAHAQNVCGLAWAPNGESFVSGGNDNSALFFDLRDVLGPNYCCSPTALVNSRIIPQDNPRTTDPRSLSRSTTTRYLTRESASTFEGHSIGNELTTSRLQQNGQRTYADIDFERGRSSDRGELYFPGTLHTSPQSRNSQTSLFASNSIDPNHAGLANIHRWSFYHSAAVKAIAFAPWQPSLVATGGGSNDRQIHFHHTGTGTTLAVINVYAQVTSLTWSSTQREIVATFGYAQPEHEVRIAVFAWPSCDCVVSIPWDRKPDGEIGRALWAIPYPGGPNDAAPERLQEPDVVHEFWQAQHNRFTDLSTERHTLPPTPPVSPERRADVANRMRIRKFTRREGETWASRTEEEGSLIVACCDQTVKFFEVWAGKSKGKSRGLGSKASVLGGSKVLEGWCEDTTIEEVGAGEDVIQ